MGLGLDFPCTSKGQTTQSTKILCFFKICVVLKKTVVIEVMQPRKRLGFHFLAVVLLGQQDSLDVGKYTTIGDGDSSKKLV